jgi:hypothetical protein
MEPLMFTLHARDTTLYSSVRVLKAQRKAVVLFPGPVGEAVCEQLEAISALRPLLGPRSLTIRLLVEIESLTWPDPEVGS